MNKPVSNHYIDGDYRRRRQHLLCPPFQPIAFSPHVTLIHLRTSARGQDFWDHGRYPADYQEFTVAELAITAFDGMKWLVLERLVLG